MSTLRGNRQDGSGVKLGTTAARQGETSGRMRYVLGISLALVIVAFAAAWWANH